MSPTDHDQDQLLGYAYGELSSPEAKSVEAHLKSCPQCTRALEDIRKVRRTMAQLPVVPAPEAGLDSLLAYAQQAARRAEAGPAARSQLWKWVLLPGTGVLATLLLTVVSMRVAQETRLAQLRSVHASKAVPPSPPPQAESAAPQAEPSAAAEVAKAAKPVESPRQRDTVVKEESKARAESKAKAESQPLVTFSIKAAPQAPKPSGDAVVMRLERPAEDFAQPTSKDESEAQPSRARNKSAAAPQESRGVAAAAPQEPGGAEPHESHGVAPASAPASRFGSPAALNREIARTRETLRTRTLARLERAWLLNHLCELLYAADRSSEADTTCDQVIRDFPGSAAADAARRLKEKNQPAPAR